MVSYKGKDTLFVCGGVGGRKGPCFAWLDNGWEQTEFEFMRLCLLDLFNFLILYAENLLLPQCCLMVGGL